MTIYESLEDEAGTYGIEILTEAIPVPHMTAAYIRTPMGTPKIILEPSTSSERACSLAEELGHHHTGTDCIVRYSSVSEWKMEARARKWANDRLLSPDAIKTAARNAVDIFELADALGVTEAFLREAIDDFMSRGLWAISKIHVDAVFDE